MMDSSLIMFRDLIGFGLSEDPLATIVVVLKEFRDLIGFGLSEDQQN